MYNIAAWNLTDSVNNIDYGLWCELQAEPMGSLQQTPYQD